MTNTIAGSLPDALGQFATAEFHRDPYPYLRRLRETEPVHRTSAGFYLVSRHRDASFVFRESGLFVSPDLTGLPDTGLGRTTRLLVNSLPSLNPPAHTRIRRIVARDFTPRRVNGMLERFRQICDRMLAELAVPLRDGEQVDLHRSWSKPFTVQVISELLGVPEADRAWLGVVAEDMVAGITAAATGGAPEVEALADRQTAELEQYLLALIAERRESPRDDLLSALVSVRDENRLDDEELFTLLWVLWLAGFDTVAIGLDNGVWTMLDHPDQLPMLRGDHTQALAFAEEVLRLVGPGIFAPTSRILTRDLELGGVQLAAGADVRPVYAAANRDPEVFPDPDRFDPSRDNSKSLSMGEGIHHCLGAFLARAEMAVGLARLHAHFPTLTNVDAPVWAGVLRKAEERAVVVALTS
ncbi:cytochrome P450 [Lentzea sp. NPDC051838]|uniref:cytochrome P450 n=1 Tax=Lentzea sp. NPDC051838 TaxID=3154849 RepID=UPI003445E4E4